MRSIHKRTTVSLLAVCVTAALASCSAADDMASTEIENSESELTVPEGVLYRVRINSSGKCVNVSGNSQNDGAQVVQWPCSTSSSNDRFDLVSVGGDVYQIRPTHSGKCLNVSGGSTANGAGVIQWRCEGGNNERFRIQRVNNGVRAVAVHSGKCIDVSNGNDGTQLRQNTCNGSANQTFSPINGGALRVGDPFAGLAAGDVAAFTTGRDDFEEVETADDGLGPIFNDASCGNCHNIGAIGGGSTRVETRFGSVSNGVFDPLASRGGSLLQDQTIGSVVVNGRNCTWALEVVPSVANRRAGRRTTPLFGLGLVDLLPDSTFTNLAASQPSNVRGKTSVTTDFVGRRTNAVGKFGWKGQNPTLFQFSGDAYLFEMGITNELAPGIAPFAVEQCPNQNGDCAQIATCDTVVGIDDEDENEDGVSDGVVAFFNFMRFLTPPPRGNVGNAENAGEQVFSRIGCASCHTATFTTPNSSSLPQAMRSRPFHPYSDFLLHNMDGGADGIVQGSAGAQDMRTAPLWGLRFITTFMHDGSQTSIDGAIRAHRGQGQAAADAFRNLGSTDRNNLLAFLRSL
jgi:hypothetical protein